MPELGKATYYLVVNSAEFDAGMAAAEEKAIATNRAIQSETTKTSGAVTSGGKSTLAALAGLAVVGYEGFKAMKEQSLASGLLNNALRDAGKTAGTTRKEMDKLTTSIFNHSYESKADIMTAEGLALRFQAVKDKARLVEDGIDAAAGTGRSLNTVMLALGRGLQNPLTGMGALGRIGIKFTQQQVDLVKHLALTKGALAAQSKMLELVEKRYKGAAEAAANAEPWRVMLRDLEQIAAEITSKLLPAFQLLASQMTKHKTITKGLVIALVALSGALVVDKLVKWTKTLEESWLITKAQSVATWAWTAATKAWTAAEKAAGLAMAYMRGEAVLFSEVLAATPWGAVLTVVGLLIVVILKLTGHLPSLATMWKYVQKTLVAGMLVVVQSAKTMAYLLLQQFTLALRGVLGLASKLPFVGKYAKSALNGINDFIGKFKPNWGSVADAWRGAGEKSGKAYSKGAADGITESTDNVKNAAQNQAVAIYQQQKEAMDALQQKVQPTIDQNVQKFTDYWTGRINGKREQFKTAFSSLIDTAFQAFDAVTERNLTRLDAALTKYQNRLNAAVKKANDTIDANLKKINDQLDAQQKQLTPAEQAIKNAQDAKDARDRQQALVDAQTQLAQAKTPQDVASAQKAIDDAKYQIWLADEQKLADQQRTALDAQIAAARDNAQKQADALKEANEKKAAAAAAAYAKQIAQEKLDYASERAVYKAHLDAWLKQEEVWLAKHPQQWSKVFGQITKVFGGAIKASTQLLGRGFITQWGEAAARAANTSASFAQTLNKAMRAIGQFSAHGFIRGVNDALPVGLYDALKNSTKAAMQRFMYLMGIRSPSKVFAKMLGVPLGQGVVVGFGHGIAPLGDQTIPIPARAAYSGGYSGSATTYRSTSSAGGGQAAAGGKGVTIVQHVKRTDPDPFQLLQDAKFAADGVFG